MLSAPAPIPAVAAAEVPVEARLCCPLCEYDLRAQVEPRCPECGYAFEWAELRDPARRLHPWLFEHHPERNVGSFFRTFLAGQRPRQFWRDLYPTQLSNLRRLLLYGAVVALLSAAPLVAILAWGLWETNSQTLAARGRAAISFAQSQPPWADKYGSLEVFLDTYFPLLPDPRAVGNTLTSPSFRDCTGYLGFLLAWPWLTLAALMVFQISMRRAKVRPGHVLRCVIYAADILLLPALIVVAGFVPSLLGSSRGSLAWFLTHEVTLERLVPLVLLVLCYRLWIAYRRYLRFEHALLTVLASQAMVGLLILKLALDTGILQ